MGTSKGMSLCLCGHVGDCPTEGSPNFERAQKVGHETQHGGFVGHGACLEDGCDCRKFTWVSFISGEN